MSSFSLDAEKILQELNDHRGRVEKTADCLQRLALNKKTNTPRELVCEQGLVKLYRYSPVKKNVLHSPPLLLVYALVNRPCILDFQEGCSMIKALVESGQTVYLVDWGYPKKEHCHLGLGDYICGFLHTCVETACRLQQCEKVNLLGVCQGGVLALCYASIYPDTVDRVITMVTPVDTQNDENLLAKSIRYVDLDLMAKRPANIPGSMLNYFFLNLNPNRLGWYKYFRLLERIDKPEALQQFMLIEQWLHDTPDQAGRAFVEFVQQIYQENALLKGTMKVGERTVDLRQFSKPVLNIYGDQDDLVPASSAAALSGLIDPGFYSGLAFSGGHLGAFVKPTEQKKVVAAIITWLAR